jgi:MFS family permease
MADKKSSKLIEFTVYMINTIGPLTGNVVMIILGTLSAEFSVSPSDLLSLIPILTIPNALIQLFAGALSDVKGRFPVVLGGLFSLCLSMIIAVFSTSLFIFSISSLFWGIGLGLISPCIVALITDLTLDKEKIPKKIANLTVFAQIGSATGPIIVSFIVLISWRLLYVVYALLVAVFICVIIIIPKPPNKPNMESKNNVKFKAVFEDISIEIRRSIVILLMFSAFLFALCFQSALLLTITEITGMVEETAMGVIFFVIGVIGAINANFVGNFMEKKGVKSVLIYGISVLFFIIIYLLLVGDITRPEILVYALIVIAFSGVVSSTLFPTLSYFSQTLSEERRGTLAGLTKASSFIGMSLIPIFYTPIYESLGITAVYITSIILAVVLAGSITLLYSRAKNII